MELPNLICRRLLDHLSVNRASMLRFTIRDLLWVTLLAALLVAWWAITWRHSFPPIENQAPASNLPGISQENQTVSLHAATAS